MNPQLAKKLRILVVWGIAAFQAGSLGYVTTDEMVVGTTLGGFVLAAGLALSMSMSGFQ